jgi:lysyl-tRNA synthetase class I
MITLKLGTRDVVLLKSVNTLYSKTYPSVFAQLNTKLNHSFNYATSYTSTNLIVCNSSLRDVPSVYESGSMSQIYKDDFNQFFIKTLIDHYPNILNLIESVKFKDVIDTTDY